MNINEPVLETEEYIDCLKVLYAGPRSSQLGGWSWCDFIELDAEHDAIEETMEWLSGRLHYPMLEVVAYITRPDGGLCCTQREHTLFYKNDFIDRKHDFSSK